MLEPETADGWALWDAIRQQTAAIERIAFWVSLFGTLWVIGVVIVVTVTLAESSGF